MATLSFVAIYLKKKRDKNSTIIKIIKKKLAGMWNTLHKHFLKDSIHNNISNDSQSISKGKLHPPTPSLFFSLLYSLLLAEHKKRPTNKTGRTRL